MITKHRVALQINLAPFDEQHIKSILPHQLRQLENQVDEVVLTLDVHHSIASRYKASNYQEKLAAMRVYLNSLQKSNKKIKVMEVDYSEETMSLVSQLFFGQSSMPKKAENGSPIYAYLYGIFSTTADYVMHMDSDMLYGGGSQTWIAEAIEMLKDDNSIFICCPLSGPPRFNKTIVNGPHAQPYCDQYIYYFSQVSTRVFLIDKRRFLAADSKIELIPARSFKAVEAFINNNPPYLALEDCLTLMMRKKGLKRVDFLGTGAGLWSLHPVLRSEGFYAALPELIQRVEQGQIPDEQRGHYNIVNAFFDWSDVERRNTFSNKIKKRLRYARDGLKSRLAGIFYN